MKALLGADAIAGSDASASGGLDDPRTPREQLRGIPIGDVRARLESRKTRHQAAREERARRRLHRPRGAR